MYNSYGYPNDAAGGGAAAALFGAFFFVWSLMVIAILIVVIAGMWKTFTKAGRPGWAAIIPIYNWYVLLEIVGRPTWWLAFLLLPFIPVIGSLALLVVAFIVYWDLAKSFGKDVGFAIGLTLLSFIFFPILGFGSAQYIGPMASGFGLPDTPGGGYPPPQGGYTPPPPGYQPPAPGYTPPAPPYTPPAPPYAPPAAPGAPPATPEYMPPAAPQAPPPAPPAAPTYEPPADPPAAPTYEPPAQPPAPPASPTPPA
jgi:hypothetical protein